MIAELQVFQTLCKFWVVEKSEVRKRNPTSGKRWRGLLRGQGVLVHEALLQMGQLQRNDYGIVGVVLLIFVVGEKSNEANGRKDIDRPRGVMNCGRKFRGSEWI